MLEVGQGVLLHHVRGRAECSVTPYTMLEVGQGVLLNHVRGRAGCSVTSC